MGGHWIDEQDKALFAQAVRILKEHLNLGRKWPLYYTLQTGRSIESLCDRVVHLAGDIPEDVYPLLRDLTAALSLPAPKTKAYRDCVPILCAIEHQMALRVDHR